MSEDFAPRKKRKPAFIVRADLYRESEDGGTPTVFYGECWAAVTAKDELIANGADIEAVTTAAFRAGFQIEAQPADA